MKLTPKKRRRILALGIVALVLLSPLLVYAMARLGVRLPAGKAGLRFTAEAGGQPCWVNTMDSRIPHTNLYDVMQSHMQAENAKLLFIGYDGALATAAGQQAQLPESAMGALAQQGGLWLAQTGGSFPGEQQTRTAPGWTSMFTGVWAGRHGVHKNGDTLDPGVRTVLYQWSERGKDVSFSYSWEPHGTETYKHEAEKFPGVFRCCADDAGTLDSMLEAVEAGQDAVFGILEYTDHAGHSMGYSAGSPFYKKAMKDAEAAANELIAAAQAREEQYGEDWLIVITTDHGGYGFDHIAHSLMETTTFIAANKAIF